MMVVVVSYTSLKNETWQEEARKTETDHVPVFLY
jgi:hypothetical protein